MTARQARSRLAALERVGSIADRLSLVGEIRGALLRMQIEPDGRAPYLLTPERWAIAAARQQGDMLALAPSLASSVGGDQ